MISSPNGLRSACRWAKQRFGYPANKATYGPQTGLPVCVFGPALFSSENFSTWLLPRSEDGFIKGACVF